MTSIAAVSLWLAIAAPSHDPAAAAAGKSAAVPAEIAVIDVKLKDMFRQQSALKIKMARLEAEMIHLKKKRQQLQEQTRRREIAAMAAAADTPEGKLKLIETVLQKGGVSLRASTRAAFLKALRTQTSDGEAASTEDTATDNPPSDNPANDKPASDDAEPPATPYSGSPKSGSPKGKSSPPRAQIRLLLGDGGLWESLRSASQRSGDVDTDLTRLQERLTGIEARLKDLETAKTD